MFKMNQDAYIQRLYKRGFIQLGAGLYSTVLTKPGSDRVVKVGRYTDQWPQYVEWATIKGYAGSFAPKVYSLKYHNQFYVAIMEQLVDTMAGIHREGGSTSSEIAYRTFREYALGFRDGKIDANAEHLIAFAKDLRNAKLASDLHDGNIMIRKDGQIVVTDPASGASNSTNLRIKRGLITKSDATIVVDFG